MKMNLFHLTDRARLKGYTTLPIYCRSESGQYLEMEAEAYVVPDMKAPILLGEDFQETYEISVLCDLDKGSRIKFGQTPWTVPTRPISRDQDHRRSKLRLRKVPLKKSEFAPAFQEGRIYC
jgi:hypothetical protein